MITTTQRTRSDEGARGRVATHLTPLGRLLLLLALLGSGAIAGAAGAAATKPHAQEWRCVTVRPGDTLWGLASDAAPDADRRETVHDVVEHNALAGGGLVPGQGVWVPNRDGASADLLEAPEEQCPAPF